MDSPRRAEGGGQMRLGTAPEVYVYSAEQAGRGLASHRHYRHHRNSRVLTSQPAAEPIKAWGRGEGGAIRNTLERLGCFARTL